MRSSIREGQEEGHEEVALGELQVLIGHLAELRVEFDLVSHNIKSLFDLFPIRMKAVKYLTPANYIT